MSFPWYFWVWGVLSCVALLLLIVGAVVGIVYLRAMSKFSEYRQETEAVILSISKKNKELNAMVASYRVSLAEARKGKNEFGQISP